MNQTTDFTRSETLGGLDLLIRQMLEKLETIELNTSELRQVYARAYVCKTYVEDLKKMETK